MNYKRINIRTKSTVGEGDLSFFEKKDVGFEMKRFYYIYGVPEKVKRGGHAHKNLYQLLFCPFGKIKIVLDDGKEKMIEMLDDPSVGLVIEPGIWRDMYWEMENSVLCVAASEEYDEQDYIRNYNEFMLWTKNV